MQPFTPVDVKLSWISLFKAGFGYGNSVSLQTDDAGHVGAAVLAHVDCVVTERGLCETIYCIGARPDSLAMHYSRPQRI